jgi:hypothetical protein
MQIMCLHSCRKRLLKAAEVDSHSEQTAGQVEYASAASGSEFEPEGNEDGASSGQEDLEDSSEGMAFSGLPSLIIPPRQVMLSFQDLVPHGSALIFTN